MLVSKEFTSTRASARGEHKTKAGGLTQQAGQLGRQANKVGRPTRQTGWSIDVPSLTATIFC
jgi:hypothetical protein